MNGAILGRQSRLAGPLGVPRGDRFYLTARPILCYPALQSARIFSSG